MENSVFEAVSRLVRQARGRLLSGPRARRVVPDVEPMESRQLLSAAAAGPHARLAHAPRAGHGQAAQGSAINLSDDVRHLKADLHALQLKSHVTRSEFAGYTQALAVVMEAPAFLRDTTDPTVLKQDLAAGDLIDEAFLSGWKTDQDWASEKAELTADLTALGYNAARLPVDQMIADLRQVAQSAGVSRAEFDQIQADMNKLQADEMAPPPSRPGYAPPPAVLLNASLRGFVRSGGHR